MDTLAALLAALKPASMMPVGIFLLLTGAAAVGWQLLAGGEGRSDVKRRLKVDKVDAAGQADVQPKKNTNAVREKAVRTAQEFYAKSDPENVARLRLKLIQAGYLDPRAIGTFFLIRLGAFIGFAVTAFAAQQLHRFGTAPARPRPVGVAMRQHDVRRNCFALCAGVLE